MGKAELKKIPDKLTDAEKKKVKNENKVSLASITHFVVFGFGAGCFLSPICFLSFVGCSGAIGERGARGQTAECFRFKMRKLASLHVLVCCIVLAGRALAGESESSRPRVSCEDEAGCRDSAVDAGR